MGYNWGEKAPSSDTRDHEGMNGNGERDCRENEAAKDERAERGDLETNWGMADERQVLREEAEADMRADQEADHAEYVESVEADELRDRVFAAATEYLNRKSRRTHPQGHTDNGGRWMPTNAEFQACCNAVRAPSRAWPWSYMTHCRTLAHVANLFGVDEMDVRAAVKAINAAQKEAGE